MNNNLEHLKKEYMETPIPKELDFMIRKSLKEGIKTMKKKTTSRKIGVIAATAAAVIVVFTAGINISPAFASTMSKIPVIGSVVRVLTFKEYVYDDGNHNADIKVPSIDGLQNKDLQDSLNEKYLDENKKLYEEFEEAMEEMKENGDGHLGVDSGYEIKTDTDKILSVGRYVVNVVGSSSSTMKYDTIDKENEILITLPSLFKDESYINAISQNIREQMLQQSKDDDSKVYWIKGIENEGIAEDEKFDKISAEQNFYITSEGKLVISFDKYEVGPGCMGIVEFEIPTDVISDILVSDEYIK